jgi:raffinose synthase
MSPVPEALAAVFHITSASGQFPLLFRVAGEGGVIIHLPQSATPDAQYPLPPTRMRRFAAAHRYEPFWMKSAVGTREEEVPPETQVLFIELEDGRVGLLVPLAGASGGPPGSMWRCALQGLPGGGLSVVADCGVRAAEARAGAFPALYITAGPRETLHTWIQRAAREVAQHLGTTLREEKRLPAFIDDFGWCTWDAFYQDVSHEKVREGLESFRAAGVLPRLLILDDGWQSAHNFGESRGRRLVSLRPNEKFGHDLTATTRLAKEVFGVRTFLVWHALQGYWGGCATVADLAEFTAPAGASPLCDAPPVSTYEAVEVPRNYPLGILHYLPEFNTKGWGATAGIIPPTAIATFFLDYHGSLAAQGVDGVKVDNQAALESFAALDPGGRVALYRAYHDALEASVATHFSPNLPLINCMSCANDLLYSYQQSALTRTSGDFYPQHAHLHGTHLWTNAFVATWFGQFIHPDWDMFHSKHPFAEFHAVGRAISGGPVYVSDKPGQHDAALLRKLVLSDGTVLRPDRPGALTADVLFADPTRENVALKVQNTGGGGRAGLLALFNCRHDPGRELPVTATARATDIPDLTAAERYAVYAHRAGTLQAVDAGGLLTFTLGQAEWELLTIVPIVHSVAVLGVLDRFIGCAAVSSERREGGTLHFSVRDRGVLGIYAEVPPAEVLVNSRTIPFNYTPPLLTLESPAGAAVSVEVRWLAGAITQ